MMNKRQAVKALIAQKAKMTQYSDLFHSETLSLLESIFGKNSGQYAFVAKIRPFKYRDPISFAFDRQDIEQFFDQCIVAVKRGMFKKDKPVPTLINLYINKYSIRLAITAFVLGFSVGAYNNPANALMRMFKAVVHLP